MSAPVSSAEIARMVQNSIIAVLDLPAEGGDCRGLSFHEVLRRYWGLAAAAG